MILKILLFICMTWAVLAPAKRALHMFQQNRYENGRFIKWLKENYKGSTVGGITLVLLFALTLVLAYVLPENIATIVLCVLFAVYGTVCFMAEKNKSYIKPLVYTDRVKRQIAVMVILWLAACAAALGFSQKWAYGVLVCFCPWLFIFLMAWITSPVEAAVRQKYLNEAKAILKDHTGLVKIGITGSFGKTSTKNIMQAMLSEQFNSLMTPASYNTPMGITRTIREMLKPIHKVFVCEMGADHVGDITELMEFVHPSIGVVTSIGPQHLNTFGSQENITKEKMQMIELLPKDGFGILNYDNEFIRSYKVQNPVETVTYGIRSEDADYRAADITYTPTGSVFTVVHGDEREEIETKLLGELNILNILSAVACARHLGVDWPTIRRAAKAMKQVEHRLELKIINGYRFIDDAFNANPVGSAMALDVLGMMPNKRIIVTPGMIDLGPKQAEINRRFGSLMKDKADVVILVGKTQTKPILEGLQESGFDMDQVLTVDTVKEAFAYIYQAADRKDTILLENDLPDAFSH